MRCSGNSFELAFFEPRFTGPTLFQTNLMEHNFYCGYDDSLAKTKPPNGAVDNFFFFFFVFLVSNEDSGPEVA